LRIFFDTNVLASAFGTRGLCADLLELVVEDHQLQTGEVVISELREVLRKKFHARADAISRAQSFLRDYHVEPLPQKLLDLQLKDRSDLLVVASALNACAEILVTGDGEILRLKTERLRILSPRGLWTLLVAGKNKS
jgi:predicted nucleic acid-binding protein